MSGERTAGGFILRHGGYWNLISYQKALIVYQATVYFCDRFIDRRSRTRDQMVQAARSGKQNIIEGSQASGTSKESEIKLINVARASQEELLEDYLDFMREHGIQEWSPDHSYAKRLRELNRIPGGDYEVFRKGIEHDDDTRTGQGDELPAGPAIAAIGERFLEGGWLKGADDEGKVGGAGEG